MKFTSPLISGTLLRRYRRFLVDVRLDSGGTVTAHCPNPGTMAGCSEPGRPVLLSDSKEPRRRHRLTWELIKMNETWVGVNVGVPHKILVEALRTRSLPGFEAFGEMHLGVQYGRKTKVDVMLHGEEQNVFINVHHVAWVEHGVALFPERESPRARKSLRELIDVAGQGHRAVGFFFVQRGDCHVLKPAEEIDREYLKTLLKAQSTGVELIVFRAEISPQQIALGTPIPFSLD